MPTIAFWNVHKKASPELIVDLIVSHGAEILVIAEAGFDPEQLARICMARTRLSLQAVRGFNSRVRMYSVLPMSAFRKPQDDRYVSSVEYRPSGGMGLLLAGVHLPSQMYRTTEAARAAVARSVASTIRNRERRTGHERTLVIGDFNMNPFELGMVEADAFHAVMDRRVAAKNTRRIRNDDRTYFYNPMWKPMGDHTSLALGTYYYNKSTASPCYFWHTFDQVLLRPALLAHFEEKSLHVLHQLGATSLLLDGEPGINKQISDHLPVLLTLNI